MSFTAPIQRFPWLLQPWTAGIYFFGGYLTILLPFVWNWRRKRFLFVLSTYTAISAIAFIAYLIWPMVIHRPDYQGTGLGFSLMRIVASLDDPSNLMPSLHIALAVVCALLVSRRQPALWVRISVWVLAVLIGVTTITVGQHYFWDVPAGIATALIGYFGVSRLLRKENGY